MTRKARTEAITSSHTPSTHRWTMYHQYRHCWRIPPSRSAGPGHQRSKAALASFGRRNAAPPGIQSDDVDGECGEDMLAVGRGGTDIAAAAQTKRPYALRQEPLHAGALGIDLFPSFGLLLLA